MGNCCMRPEPRDWAGEDWGSLTSKHSRGSKRKVFDESQELNAWNAEKESVVSALRSASSNGNGKVTIKISKKELHELLMKGAIQNHKQKKEEGALMSAEQVLVRLMNGGHHIHHRPWEASAADYS